MPTLKRSLQKETTHSQSSLESTEALRETKRALKALENDFAKTLYDKPLCHSGLSVVKKIVELIYVISMRPQWLKIKIYHCCSLIECFGVYGI